MWQRHDNSRMSPDANIVLVVDDDAAVRASLKFALEIEGWQVKLYDRGMALLADTNLTTAVLEKPLFGSMLVESIRTALASSG